MQAYRKRDRGKKQSIALTSDGRLGDNHANALVPAWTRSAGIHRVGEHRRIVRKFDEKESALAHLVVAFLRLIALRFALTGRGQSALKQVGIIHLLNDREQAALHGEIDHIQV